MFAAAARFWGKKSLPYRRGLRGFRGASLIHQYLAAAIMIACAPGREWRQRQDTIIAVRDLDPVCHFDRDVCGLSRMASTSLRALDGGSARDGGSGSCRVLAAQRRHAQRSNRQGRAGQDLVHALDVAATVSKLRASRRVIETGCVAQEEPLEE